MAGEARGPSNSAGPDTYMGLNRERDQSPLRGGGSGGEGLGPDLQQAARARQGLKTHANWAQEDGLLTSMASPAVTKIHIVITRSTAPSSIATLPIKCVYIIEFLILELQIQLFHVVPELVIQELSF